MVFLNRLVFRSVVTSSRRKSFPREGEVGRLTWHYVFVFRFGGWGERARGLSCLGQVKRFFFKCGVFGMAYKNERVTWRVRYASLGRSDVSRHV